MKQFLKILLLFVFAISLHPRLHSQSLVADTMLHFGYLDAVKGMIVTDSGDCILMGKMDTDSITPKNIWVNRLGFQGDTIVVTVWDTIFYPQNASRASKMIWTQDGNFIIVGSWNNNNMILKMSPEGDSLTTLLFPGNGDNYFSDVIELPNSDLVLLQSDVDDDLYCKMIKMTSTGTILWEEEYDDRYYSSLGYYQSDTFLVGGYEYHQDYQHLLFGAYNPNGSQYFSDMYQEYYGANNMMKIDSAGIFLGNSKQYVTSPSHVAQVIKMSADGEVQWDVDFTGVGSETVRDIATYDNYMVTCSETDGSVIIGAITYHGVLFSALDISLPLPQSVDVEIYEDFLYFTGRLTNGINGKDVFFLKFQLDSLFTYISGVPELATEDNVLVYPNPVNDKLYVKSLNPYNSQGIVNVSIYNMMGRLESVQKMNGFTEEFVSMKDLPQGLYLVVVEFENKPPVTKKVLVVH